MEGSFEKQFFQNCVRPSVQKPIALVSVDFASPKVMGSKKRYSISDTLFAFKSFDLASQKGVDTKNGPPPVKAFFFVKFATAIFPAVSPHRGLT